MRFEAAVQSIKLLTHKAEFRAASQWCNLSTNSLKIKGIWGLCVCSAGRMPSLCFGAQSLELLFIHAYLSSVMSDWISFTASVKIKFCHWHDLFIGRYELHILYIKQAGTADKRCKCSIRSKGGSTKKKEKRSCSQETLNKRLQVRKTMRS